MSILINSFSLQNRGLACKSPLGMLPGMFRPQTMPRNCLGVLAGKDLKRAWEPSDRELYRQLCSRAWDCSWAPFTLLV